MTSWKRSIRALLDPRYGEAAEFISTIGHPRLWTADDLASCAVLRLDDDGTLAGYVWLHFTPIDPFALHIHAALSRTYRGRAFTPQIATDVCALARLMGAQHLVGTYASEAQAALWLRFFTRFVPAEQNGREVSYRVDQPHGLLVP